VFFGAEVRHHVWGSDVSKAEDYWRNAEQCRDWAETAISGELKAMWLELARHWELLAESFEPTGETRAMRESPAQEDRRGAK
jgi:hypothetical protein